MTNIPALPDQNRIYRVKWGGTFGPKLDWVEDMMDIKSRAEKVVFHVLRYLELCYSTCAAAPSDQDKLCETARFSVLGHGVWNYAFSITLCHEPDSAAYRELVFRVAKPVTARDSRIAAEVAAMLWVCHHTSIPVLGVLAFESSVDTMIGYE
ncbi:hypothetical protein B0T26DRAFT_265497 [Lasiosphaeria miniovina]|uniref:Protein kinase domain-containing protein n=1 Tax=Lasiosphaeria miniovina TaxID=1954250 RepID=A0AA40DUE9_9PEZI|nr:uncharacterized protein B0T26DRAFT_265497 [Lasiosphaeria miniovina]KAK0716749.1 hypothetical protein B0T26DRAFT_265497 [Lasiosphaeria miniovina]